MGSIQTARATSEHRLSRRSALVAGGGPVVGTGLAGRRTQVLGQAAPGATPTGTAALGADPFTPGLGSGDPMPDPVGRWSRLAPEPLADGGRGGMPRVPVAVRWELSTDDGFRRVVRSGTTTASPTLAHSVHVDVTGLVIFPGDDIGDDIRVRRGQRLHLVRRRERRPRGPARLGRSRPGVVPTDHPVLTSRPPTDPQE